jgi:glucose/arabinose dehydrogenase
MPQTWEIQGDRKMLRYVWAKCPHEAVRTPATRIRRRRCLLAVGLWLLSSCHAGELVGPADGSTEPGVLATSPWIPDAIAVIGEEEFLFIDRGGTLYHYLGDQVTEVTGIPVARTVDVYGGLLEVSLHPEFGVNRLVYIAYNDADFGLAVARFELNDNRAQSLEVIYESDEFSIGSRIAWEDSSHLFLSFGVGGSPYPEPGSQDLHSDRGKIHRLTAAGQIPPDNPVLPGASGPSTIWSYGHRNPQGLYYDTARRTLYETEHGPLGGDELNIITAGGNYGWPLFSYGVNYDGTPVSDMTEQEAAAISILPVKFWGPDFRVAPSGLLRVADSQFPSWEGSFLGDRARQDWAGPRRGPASERQAADLGGCREPESVACGADYPASPGRGPPLSCTINPSAPLR